MVDIQQVIEKIKKLNRLATSSNIHEAASAAAMAAELLLKYQISEASLSGSDQEDETIKKTYMDDPSATKRNRAVWKGSLAHAIARSLGCEMYWSGAKIVIVGRDSDMKAVTYLFMAVSREIDRLADECFARENTFEHGKTWKASFRLGAVAAVRERLQVQRRVQLDEQRLLQAQGDHSASKALMVLDNRALAIQSEMDKIFGKRRGKGVSSTVRSGSGYMAGHKAGQGIDLGNSRPALGGRKPSLKD